ncbi:prephenate dehydratase [Sphingosinicellaceae bacterium]|nr:prephenate dehydratase [Sphingosinicellaceae bacterium]
MDNYPAPAQRLVTAMTDAADAEPRRATAFQGAPGAYSHQAVREMFPQGLPLPCLSFEDAIEAVQTGAAARAVIPIENSLHGRVADIHFLLPESGLHVVGEHFVRVSHCLMSAGPRDAIREAASHPQALGQCRQRLREWGITPVGSFDTAGAAAMVAERREAGIAAIASTLAAELYGLTIHAEGIEDAAHNTTRFVVLARDAVEPPPGVPVMTSINFEVRQRPAALFKALGGFATNGINITKLESYLRDGGFAAAEFYAEIVGAPSEQAVANALDELRYHTNWLRLLGTYVQARPRA